MGSIVWNEKKILEFNDADKDLIIVSCNSEGIKYSVDNENIILFPALLNKTLILKSLTQQEELKTLMESVKVPLIGEGAAVILDKNFTNKAAWEYLDVQIVIAVSVVEQQTDLTVYLPFNLQKTSISVTKHLVKQLNLLEKKVTYRIANSWNKICAPKHWTYIFGNDIPTLVLEIALPTGFESFLTGFGDVLVKSIMEELGYKPSNEEKSDTLRFLDSLKEKKLCKDILTKEQQELEEIACKLKSCKDELNQLKQSYKEAEEKLEKINNATEEKAVEEQQNSTKSKNKSKKSKGQANKSKKIHLSLTTRKDSEQAYLYHELPFIAKYSKAGPVHQFQRPRPHSSDVVLPPKLIPEYITQNKKENRGDKEISSKKRKINKNIGEINNIYNLMYPK
ncbi:hypothetical protein [Natronincola ferrireducens]|uniref:Uncharacterized protein n=1 Tax=Natronincola ferrireducens TaxID=393762 RepID=A0A1G9CS75_9FIRM|nr:hypothetical protein [Natronincola ferrireducens]SDK54543.1 hypothetical protein SAMN05660472_01543 [Natronincola ferrireducens]